jgi:cytochrome P450
MIEDHDAIPAIVEELMRRYTFVSPPRYIVEDTEVGGVKFSAGESVLVPLHMIGWDESLTTCPAEVRLDRPHCRHAGFGSGIHTCLGIHLARLEMVTFYRVWAKKIGHFRLAEQAPLRFRAGSVQSLKALHLEWEIT